jgi:hypothetical protein
MTLSESLNVDWVLYICSVQNIYNPKSNYDSYHHKALIKFIELTEGN